MNYYEILYVVHPALESGRLKDIILSIQTIFDEVNVKILSTDVWGKKKLAYLIDKQQYGTYVLLQFQSDGNSNQTLSTELEHNPNILTYLISKIDETSIQKDIKSLDEQIIGHVASSTEDTVKQSSGTEENTAEESSETEDTAEESSETEDTAEESSETEDTAEESSETEDTAEESSETEDTAEESSETEDTAEESSETEDTAEESSETEDTAEESSETEDTAEESLETEDVVGDVDNKNKELTDKEE